jgi:hypothetical protein
MILHVEDIRSNDPTESRITEFRTKSTKTLTCFSHERSSSELDGVDPSSPPINRTITNYTMKLSAAVAFLAIGGASAYSIPSRSDIRSLGSKSFAPAARRQAGASMRMEGT